MPKNVDPITLIHDDGLLSLAGSMLRPLWVLSPGDYRQAGDHRQLSPINGTLPSENCEGKRSLTAIQGRQKQTTEYDSETFMGGMMASSYLAAAKSGLLAQRIVESRQLLKTCNLCPRSCNVDRLAGELGPCSTGAAAEVSGYGLHFGEEAVLVGARGSGTIFFCGCSLLCVFCQNYDISHAEDSGCFPVDDVQLARLMVDLQEQGCNNINLVTPGHVVPQILAALPHAVENGLSVPIVYNSSGYDSVSTLQLLDGIVDIYMPDFKFWSADSARRYASAEDYPEMARRALKEMQRQVGDLKVNERGEAEQGLIVRHLLMPSGAAETDAILKFLAEEISVNCFVNIMDQYRVSGAARQFPELDAVISTEEYEQAIRRAEKYGLTRLRQ